MHERSWVRPKPHPRTFSRSVLLTRLRVYHDGAGVGTRRQVAGGRRAVAVGAGGAGGDDVVVGVLAHDGRGRSAVYLGVDGGRDVGQRRVVERDGLTDIGGVGAAGLVVHGHRLVGLANVAGRGGL